MSLMQSISARFAKTTPRERAGMALMAALAALTMAIYALEWADQSAVKAEEATQAAADAAATQASLGDATFRQAISARAGNVRSWSRTGDDFARDEILAEIEALSLQSGLAEASIAVIESAQGARVNAVNASIAADFDWASFLSLLEAFETSELSVTVTSVDVAETDAGQRVVLLVSAPLIAEQPS